MPVMLDSIENLVGQNCGWIEPVDFRSDSTINVGLLSGDVKDNWDKQIVPEVRLYEGGGLIAYDK